jgi:class 3 adenylate cyclase
LDDESSSYYAVSVALKQQEALKELNKNWKEKGVGEVKARIGLHIGNAIV